jgi:MHS family proline/betaine transporter-like MFS transporter
MKNLNISKYVKLKLSDTERALVRSVTFGSQFEWFEFFLFVYWSRIFETEAHFSGISASVEEFIYAILLLCSGLFARPIGGIIFGRMGDKLGRKTAFMRSVIWITLPSIILTLTPSFPTWAYSSLIYLGIMRLLQGIPAGGELPGALCLLYEGSTDARKQYICSYLFVGSQLGQILSVLLIMLLQAILTHEQLLNWGWRLSFGVSSIMGIFGGFFRKRLFSLLHETKDFEDLKTEHRVERSPLKKSFKNYKKRMMLVLFLSIFEVSGFYLIYYYLFERHEILKLNQFYSPMVFILYLVALTIAMPILGSIRHNIKVETLFKISALGIISTSIPFFFAIDQEWSSFLIYLLLTLLMFFFCIQFSFIPSFIAGLFPTQVRFTCIGFSFNITDGVIGGIIPLFATWLTKITGLEAAFVTILPVSALIFLFCLKLIKKEKKNYGY